MLRCGGSGGGHPKVPAIDDYAATYEASALRGFAKETRGGYAAKLGHLACMLQRQPRALARESEDKLLQSVRESRSDSGPRRLLCAVRVRPVIVAMDWKLVEAVVEFHNETTDACSKLWGSTGCLWALCRLCSTPADWELAALVPSASAWGCGQRRQSPCGLTTVSSIGEAPRAARGMLRDGGTVGNRMGHLPHGVGGPQRIQPAAAGMVSDTGDAARTPPGPRRATGLRLCAPMLACLAPVWRSGAAMPWAADAEAPPLGRVVHPANAARVRVPGARVVVPERRPARAAGRSRGAHARLGRYTGTTLQMWAPWVRDETPRVPSLPPAAIGKRAARPDGVAAGGAEAPEKRLRKV